MNRLHRMVLICALIVGWGVGMLLLEWVALELLRLRSSLDATHRSVTSKIEQPVTAP
jgi:hypothetical protein